MQRPVSFRVIRLAVAALLAAGAAYSMPPRPGVDMPRAAAEEESKLHVNTVTEPVRDAGLADVHNVPGDVRPLVSGTKRFIVVPIRYPDFDSAYPASTFQSMLFGTWPSGTAHDYYNEVSYGIFNLTGTVTGWYVSDHNKAYYGADSGPTRGAMLAKEAAQKADASVNYAQYDQDGDGYVDAFTCFHSWYGREETNNGSDIHSHAWSFSSAGIGVYSTNDADPVNGGFIKINSYTIDPERSNYSNNGTMSCIGVFCHEWGHALGLPDLYDTDGGSSGLGNWCLMAGGSWGGNGGSPWRPVHLSSWPKVELGWLNPRAVRLRNSYSLSPVETSPDAFWLIGRNRTFREYYLVENRRQTLCDAQLPGQGILVYHVDDSVIAARRWWGQVNAGGPGWKYGVALEQADGLDDLFNTDANRGDAGDPYPGSTDNTRFDSTASPNSRTNYPQASPLMTGSVMRNPSIVPGPAATCSLSSGVAAAFTGGPDIYGNAWIDSDTTGGPTYSWVDISSTGTLLGTGDDARWSVALPFTYTFCGTSYGTVWVCTNGWLAFGANPQTSNPSNTAIPNTSLPNAAAYVFWDDLNFIASDSGGIFYEITGAAPNRHCIVTWKNGRAKNGPTRNHVTFQAILGEDGGLVMQYQDCATGDTLSNWGRGATVGIEDAGGSYGLQYLANGAPAGNLLSGQRAIQFVAPPTVHDLAVVRINVPVGTIDSGTVTAPACSVNNRGNVVETYRVRMKIGSFYNRDTLVTGHAAGTTRNITFPATAAWPRGNYAETCYSTLAVDTIRGNDTAFGSVTVRVRDASCATLFAPSGTIDSGTSVTPECSVFNYGSDAATFMVRMRIGTVYNNAQLVANQAPGTGVRVGFPSWPANVVATHVVRCSTELTGDARQANDRRTTTLTVRRVNGHDVACMTIVAPSGPIDSGTVVTPGCSVHNFSPVPETYRVRMRFGGYNDTAHVAAHPAGATIYVSLPGWTAQPVGTFAVTCSTELTGDEAGGNDAFIGSASVQRPGVDVGVTRLIRPVGTIASGLLVAPACSTYNYGNTVLTYQARMRIGASYDTAVTVAGHAPGTAELVLFPDWYATPTGTRTVTVFTDAADMAPENDTAYGTCSVVRAGGTGWVAMTPMLSAPGTKAPYTGAWLAFNSGNARIYAAKGCKRDDFYVYDPVANSWLWRGPIPSGSEQRLPYAGAAAAADGNNYIYATTGNNTLMFWRYDVEADTWHEMAKVPLGINRKKVKAGTDMAYVDRGGSPAIYLLKGYKNEFYRYDIARDSWATMDAAPRAARPKWDKGSFMVYDGDRYLYAHKAKYHEFWRFDIDSRQWDTLHPLPGMPTYSVLTGRSKKSRDGGCAAWYYDAVYALKGGNTTEFWKYVAADSQWTEIDTIPSIGISGSRKRVKGGADIVATDDGALYAMKGNKTWDLWRYLVPTGADAGEPPSAPAREGLMASTRFSIGDCRLAIAPNPMVGGFVTVHSSLPAGRAANVTVYDALGRAVYRSPLVVCTSAFTLDLRSLPAGAYLVKLTAGCYQATAKLVTSR